MKTRNLLLAFIPALLALQLSNCSDPPQPVDTPKAAAGAAQPAGHPGMPATEAKNGEEARVSGTILFEGAQFEHPTGTLFVNVRMKGQKAPWLSRKYPLEGVVLAKNASGAMSMPFELRANDPKPMEGTFNSNTVWITAPEGMELELYACYKPTGDASSKTLADAVAVFQAGKSDYQLALKLP